MVREFTLPGAGLHAPKLRVHGFGACMIAGTPHSFEESFFYKFLEQLSQDIGLGIESRVVSLGGFPTYKAVAHVNRALAKNPEYVVLQLGSTDSAVSLKRHFGLMLNQTPRFGTDVQSQSKFALNASGPFKQSKARKFVEFSKDYLCRILSVTPVHGGVEVYLPAIRQVVEKISEAGARPILLAPFPHGDRVSNRWAWRFTNLLAELAKNEDVIFVDTFNGLSDIPQAELLYSDRLHLTPIGHERIARLLIDSVADQIKVYAKKAA